MPIIEEFEKDYEETDIPIETDEDAVEIKEYAEAGKIMLGEE